MSVQALIDARVLCCPSRDRGRLSQVSEERLVCSDCRRTFRVVDGRPILLDDSRSIFSSDEVARHSDVRQFPENFGWRNKIRGILPAATSRDEMLTLFEKHKAMVPDDPTIVVLGCGFTRTQYQGLFPTGQLILTDVTLQGDADVVCDGECLPFCDQSIDCIVVDQVLEHTLNPLAVVEEIYRCLKMGAIVYSGIPFLTPVHGYPFDFQRYTPLGHRMLFRRFQQLEMCVTQGPVSAMSKAMIGCLTSLSRNRSWKRLSSLAVRLVARPFLWLDKRYTSETELTVPAATAFLGRKQLSEVRLSDLVSTWSISAGA
jgi:uncharacterized protein YbaR (Trm112 family)/SAM-dependent methyltransferase